MNAELEAEAEDSTPPRAPPLGTDAASDGRAPPPARVLAGPLDRPCKYTHAGITISIAEQNAAAPTLVLPPDALTSVMNSLVRSIVN